MLVVGRERRRQDEPARVAARRDAGLLAAHAAGRAADPLRRDGRRAIAVDGTRDGVAARAQRDAAPGRRRRRRALNGARLPSAESLRREVATLVFTPDRLAVVKGGPAARRAYFDRVLGTALPGPRRRCRRTTPRRSRSATPRCAACSFGLSRRDVARAVDGARRRARRSARRAAARDARGARAGLRGARRRARAAGCAARLRRASRRPPPTLEARLARDLERGTTGLGPHLDDVLIASGDRDLRQFGSQGEQRLAVLSLLLAEAELLPTLAAPAARRRALGARPRPAPRSGASASRAWGRRDHGDAARPRCRSSPRSSWRWTHGSAR